jgi:YggT family protein
MSIFRIIGWLIEIYLLLLIGRALMSWFQAPPGSVLAQIDRALAMVTEPVLAPVRRVIRPVRVGGAYLDLSILVVFLVAQFVLLPLFS